MAVLLNINRSFVLSTKGVASETPSTENRRARHLCHLALRAAAQLQWNLEVLEEKYRTVTLDLRRLLKWLFFRPFHTPLVLATD